MYLNEDWNKYHFNQYWYSYNQIPSIWSFMKGWRSLTKWLNIKIYINLFVWVLVYLFFLSFVKFCNLSKNGICLLVNGYHKMPYALKASTMICTILCVPSRLYSMNLVSTSTLLRKKMSFLTRNLHTECFKTYL